MRQTCVRLALLAGTAIGAASGHGQTQWAAPADGLWRVAANWSPANVPDTAGETAVLGFDTAYLASVDANVTVETTRVTNILARLGVRSGVSYFVGSGGLQTDGQVIVNVEGFITPGVLQILGGSAVTGRGRITLNGGGAASRAQLNTSGSNQDIAVFGSGLRIEGSGALNGRFISEATILGATAAPGTTIVGELRQQGVGTFNLDGLGRVATIDGGTVTGGAINTPNGGFVRVTGSTSTIGDLVNNGTVQVLSGATLRVQNPGLALNGQVLVNAEGFITPGVLQISGGSTVTGTGRITLNGGGAASRAQLNTSGSNQDIAVFGPGLRIEGSGALNGRFISEATILGAAAVPGTTITGVLDQQGAGGFSVDGPGRVATIEGGTVTGGVINTSNGGSVRIVGLDSNANGVTNNGTVQVLSGARLQVGSPGMTLNGQVLVNAEGFITPGVLQISGGSTVTGTGRITLNGGGAASRAQLNTSGSNADTATLGPGLRIEGSGALNGRFISEATILGAAAVPGTTITGVLDQQGAGGFSVDGVGRVASIEDGMVRGGVIRTTNGGVVRVLGTMPRMGGVTNDGTVQLLSGATLTVLTPGLTVNGQLLVNAEGFVTPAVLMLTAGSTLGGTGRITLNAGSAPSRAQLNTTNSNGDAAFIGAGVRVEGTGALNGRLACQGTIAPGSPVGTMGRDGAVTLSPASVVEIELAGPGASQKDAFNGVGTLTLDGTLRVRFLNGYVMPLNSSYTAITGGTVLGRFAAIDGPTGVRRRFDVTYTANSATIVCLCDADYNGDRFVDFFDYDDFVGGFEAGDPAADFNRDGFLDFFDYDDFIAAFQEGC